MEYLTSLFNRVTEYFTTPKNLEFIGTYHFHPNHPVVNPHTYAAHQSTLHHIFRNYLTTSEIDLITDYYSRSIIDEDSVLADLFHGDVDDHQIPFDEHVAYGLNCMADAFRPPQPAMPVHILDVQHHYPYKWHVNSEPPFSTDDYFLKKRNTFADFWDWSTHSFRKYVDPIDASRRYGNKIIENLLPQITPAKFGFQKAEIFSWVRRWQHVIKSGFTDLAGLYPDDTYLKQRFIFPMLLHSKTAIIKKGDPNKMRTIWGCSKLWVTTDTEFYWEYIAWIKLNPGITPMLWGFETFTGGWMRLNHALYCQMVRRSFITIDWSRFDKRAYFALIYLIMMKVRTFLDFSRGYVPTKDYPTSTQWDNEHTQRLENLWTWTLECLFNSPIVLPDGRMYRRRFAGIPSGLYITQLLDSWYNYTMLATILSAMGLDPKHCIIKVQGDDSIIRLGILIPPDEHENFLTRMANLALLYFNASLSKEKSEMRSTLNNCEVLSYRHTNGMPYRDEIKMLAQFYHTKARNPQPEIAMAQAIGFAYASCGNHNRVYECLRAVYNHYAEQGYSPNRAGLALVFGNSPDVTIPHYEIDHFPTIFEIKQYLTTMEYDSSAQDAKTWPLTFFEHKPCERPV